MQPEQPLQPPRVRALGSPLSHITDQKAAGAREMFTNPGPLPEEIQLKEI